MVEGSLSRPAFHHYHCVVVGVVVGFLFQFFCLFCCLTTLYALNTPKIINENKQRLRWRQGQVYKMNFSQRNAEKLREGAKPRPRPWPRDAQTFIYMYILDIFIWVYVCVFVCVGNGSLPLDATGVAA